MTGTRLHPKQGLEALTPPAQQECHCACHTTQMSSVERKSLSLMLRSVYEAQRKLEGRNYAKEHSFEEWLEVP